MWNVFPSRNDGNAAHRIGGGRLNADRRVYVSINPDARGINPRTKEGNEGREGNRSIALIETAVSPILMQDYHCRR